jgi:TPP-dependent pyruvate/acetoin dehydrogenase alpha subunit
VERAAAPRNLDVDALGGRALELYRVMVRTRLFERFCMRIRAAGEVFGNTYPSLGQEALGAAGLALAADDVVFPSYRSRPICFGKGASVIAHLRELVGGKGSALGGREVFHHAMFPESGIMPGSSMIGGWVPVAAGHALAQRFDRAEAVTVCCIGDGVLGAGDLHEALNMVGVWKLPFVLLVENNAYQVASRWDMVRTRRALAPYVEPYGFVVRPVDGNDAFDVYQSTLWARRMALAGQPAMLDCHTFRMGGYSSHFTVERKGAEEELAAWGRRDPIDLIATWLTGNAGILPRELDEVSEAEQSAIEDAFATVRAEAGEPPSARRPPEVA